MCLEHVSGNTHDPKASGIGWKVFRTSLTGELSPEYYSVDETYEVGVWYEAYAFNYRDKRKIGFFDKHYWRGFHIWKTKKAAQAWNRTAITILKIRKVQWRHRLALGTQNKRKVIVAKEIKIL